MDNNSMNWADKRRVGDVGQGQSTSAPELGGRLRDDALSDVGAAR